MRLISNFHDYYDGVLKTQLVEVEPVYDRKQAEVQVLTDDLIDHHEVQSMLHNPEECGQTIHLHVIGFCGKLYPIYLNDDHTIKSWPEDVDLNTYDWWRWNKNDKKQRPNKYD